MPKKPTDNNKEKSNPSNAAKLSDLEALSHLARLNLEDEEKTTLPKQMQSIQRMIDELLVTSVPDDTEPMAHPLGIAQKLRDDEVTTTPDSRLVSASPQSAQVFVDEQGQLHSLEDAQSQGIQRRNNGKNSYYFIIPKVIE